MEESVIGDQHPAVYRPIGDMSPFSLRVVANGYYINIIIQNSSCPFTLHISVGLLLVASLFSGVTIGTVSVFPVFPSFLLLFLTFLLNYYLITVFKSLYHFSFSAFISHSFQTSLVQSSHRNVVLPRVRFPSTFWASVL